MKRKKPRTHEWTQGYIGSRTVCGLRVPPSQLHHANLVGITVYDLGDVEVADRCKNCMRMRAAIGTSKKLEAQAG